MLFWGFLMLIVNCLGIDMAFEKKSAFGISLSICATILTLILITLTMIKDFGFVG